MVPKWQDFLQTALKNGLGQVCRLKAKLDPLILLIAEGRGGEGRERGERRGGWDAVGKKLPLNCSSYFTVEVIGFLPHPRQLCSSFSNQAQSLWLFLAKGENRRLLERNSWKEQGGWKKKAAHDVLVRDDAKGHPPEVEWRSSNSWKYLKIKWKNQYATNGHATSVPDTNSTGSPEYLFKGFFLIGMKFATHLGFISMLFYSVRKCSTFHLIICKWMEKVGCV